MIACRERRAEEIEQRAKLKKMLEKIHETTIY